MPLTSSQKKLAWIAAAIVGLYFFGPSIIRTVYSIASYQQRQAPKPSPTRPVAVPDSPKTATVIPASAIDLQSAKMLGNWMARADLPGRGRCGLVVQVKAIPEKPNYFSGYSTVNCEPSLAILGWAPTAQNRALDAINASTPTSTIMSGPAVNGSIQFQIDKNIGIPFIGCKITAFKLTPFSDGAVAAEWRNAPCPDGQMILRHPGNNLF